MFNADKFQSAKFRPRTAQVPVPELAEFFEDGAKAEFTVRNLDATEFGRVIDEERANKKKVVQALAGAVNGGAREVILTAVREYLDDDRDRLPDDVIRRIYMIEFGTVEPKLTHADVLKITKNAEVFYRLSTKIQQLTGMGPTSGESTVSGQNPASKPRSSSRRPETSAAE